jgi:tRNA(Ile)-lysidine synthetase-like protein
MLYNSGFTIDQTSKVLEAKTGSFFYSPTHELLIDRTTILCRKIKVPNDINIELQKVGTYVVDQLFHIVLTAELDHPITIRKWRSGDRIKLRNGHIKTIKKYLIDHKVNRWEKDNVIVVDDGHDVSIIYPSDLLTESIKLPFQIVPLM